MDKKKFLFATLFASALALGGCAGDSTKKEEMASGPAVEAQEAIAAAKAALETADKGGFAWRDTGKMIENAEDAAAKGEYAKAIKIAEEAEIQSELAARQAREQATAGPHF